MAGCGYSTNISVSVQVIGINSSVTEIVMVTILVIMKIEDGHIMMNEDTSMKTTGMRGLLFVVYVIG